MQFHYLKSEEFWLIEYARHIKMDESLEDYKQNYHYKFVKIDRHIDIRNFTVTEDEFSKYLPMHNTKNYLQVFKSKSDFNKKLLELKQKVIAIQILLLALFGFISYILARNALKPMKESISTLDKFAKDLIHDLNTPVTSIKLNMKLLEKIPQLKENNAVIRLNKSVQSISELHENLTILLQEETFQMEVIDLCEIIDEIIDIQKAIYSDIDFITNCKNFSVKLNHNAIKQILQNIISNACKYNTTNGYVKIYNIKNSLYIQDSGKGIREPEKIFERTYSDEHSSGIGLDIVKRLADTMDIEIDVQTKERGSIFILTMKQ
jgi:two-component system OmpR family sensor kinase